MHAGRCLRAEKLPFGAGTERTRGRTGLPTAATGHTSKQQLLDTVPRGHLKVTAPRLAVQIPEERDQLGTASAQGPSVQGSRS